jgi:hypothetical protein
MRNGQRTGRPDQGRTEVLDSDDVRNVNDVGALEQIARGEVDIQISTARRFPRSIEAFQKKALSMATIDEETAASCFYVLPKRKGAEKAIEGPSARLAEIAAAAYGHMAIAGRIVEEGDRFVVAQGAAWDLENNVRRVVEVRRRITSRDGGRYSDDMIMVTCNAAIAIATRNAVFQVIPQAYTRQIYHACREVAVGTQQTLSKRRGAMLEHFQKMGVEPARVFALLEVRGTEDITLEHLATLARPGHGHQGRRHVDRRSLPARRPGARRGSRRCGPGAAAGGHPGARAGALHTDRHEPRTAPRAAARVQGSARQARRGPHRDARRHEGRGPGHDDDRGQRRATARQSRRAVVDRRCVLGPFAVVSGVDAQHGAGDGREADHRPQARQVRLLGHGDRHAARRPSAIRDRGLRVPATLQGALHRRRPRRIRSGAPRLGVPCGRAALHPGAAAAEADVRPRARAARAHDGLAETITPPHLAHEVTDLFWRWAESFELDLDALLLVEEKQRDDQGHSWTPDLVYAFDDVLEIRDWKTHFAIFSDARAAAEFQAKWYCWQARKLWPGFSRYRIVFVFVRYGIDVSAEFDVPELEYFETSVQGIVAAIRHAGETNVFPAIPGASCGVCSLTCDVAEHPERVPLRLISRVSAERALGVKLAMTAALRNIDAALQAYCTEHGAVTCNGMEVAHRPASKQEFPADGVYQVLHDAGIPPRFTVSKSALRSYLTTKKFSHVRAPLEALAKVTPANRFSVKRVGHDDAESEE